MYDRLGSFNVANTCEDYSADAPIKRTRRAPRLDYGNPATLDKDDPGLACEDHDMRLDPEFNESYILACIRERARYNAQHAPANNFRLVANAS